MAFAVLMTGFQMEEAQKNNLPKKTGFSDEEKNAILEDLRHQELVFPYYISREGLRRAMRKISEEIINTPK